MKVLMLGKYGRMGASSRLRLYQYLPYLEARGIEVRVAPLFENGYLEALYFQGRRSFAKISSAYLKRAGTLLKSGYFDLIWLEYELFPWLPPWAEDLLSRVGIPYVVEYDDAVFHRYDLHSVPVIRWLLGHKIDAVMKRASLVIAGNRYIAERALRAGAARVEILPTVVDLARYRPVPANPGPRVRIGWMGSPTTVSYLEPIVPALREVCRNPDTRLTVVGAGSLMPENLPSCETREWSEGGEVDEIGRFDIGIMPLSDDPWTRGKCGYKLIQYMACGRPVVASPVGVNAEIVEDGINGYLADSVADWVRCLSDLRDNLDLRRRMGRMGRKKVETRFSLQAAAPRLLTLLREVGKGELSWKSDSG